MTESFTKLKLRYNALKESSSDADDREKRLVTQNMELKQSMLDLNTWCSELRANTEKKLTASFESATLYQAKFKDKENREAKVSEELKVARRELKNRDDALSDALFKVAKHEEDLSKAEQAAKSTERILSHLREQLAQSEAQFAASKRELIPLRKKLEETALIASKFEAADSAGRAAEAKLTTMEKENKDLKARAYDDLTKVNNLEAELADKKLEFDEMTAMCEELMAREEQRGRA